LKVITTVLNILVRLLVAFNLILGSLLWLGYAGNLLPIHVIAGFASSLSLWVLCALAAISRVHLGRALFAFIWGLSLPLLGLSQDRLMIGDFHWIIQVLHLLIGVGTAGVAETLAGGIKQRLISSQPLLSSELTSPNVIGGKTKGDIA
jgi:hypothetical protein